MSAPIVSAGTAFSRSQSYRLDIAGQDERVLEKFLDQVDVGHDHAAAAVALQAKLVHGITVGGLLANRRGMDGVLV